MAQSAAIERSAENGRLRHLINKRAFALGNRRHARGDPQVELA
ncbi:unnamed protein product, partial [Adineta steineri]